MTIVDAIMRQQRVVDAATRWRETRAELAVALGWPARHTGVEVAVIRLRHDAAVDELAAALDDFADKKLPAVANGTSGVARRITQLEGEVALLAISWLHTVDAAIGGDHRRRLHSGRAVGDDTRGEGARAPRRARQGRSHVIVRIAVLLLLAVVITLLFRVIERPRRRRHWSSSAGDRGGYLEERR